MRNLSALAIVATVLFAHPVFAFDLPGILGGSDEGPKLNLIHVQDLARLMNDPSGKVYVYDADPPDVRPSTGVIPGAHLLASSSSYDLSELPADKDSNLVFYCHDTKCMASHAAAKRAIKAGYPNVSVMADGIMGWRAAGMKVATVN